MLYRTVLALLLLSLSAAALISLPSSPLPSNASQLLDPYLISFSFETAYIQDFLGNTSHPNELVLNLLGEIEKRTGGIAVRFVPFAPSMSCCCARSVLSRADLLDLSGQTWRNHSVRLYIFH